MSLNILSIIAWFITLSIPKFTIDKRFIPCYDIDMIAETNIRVTFVTSKDNKELLTKLAQNEKRTLSSQIDYIVDRWLKEQEVKPCLNQ